MSGLVWRDSCAAITNDQIDEIVNRAALKVLGPPKRRLPEPPVAPAILAKRVRVRPVVSEIMQSPEGEPLQFATGPKPRDWTQLIAEALAGDSHKVLARRYHMSEKAVGNIVWRHRKAYSL